MRDWENNIERLESQFPAFSGAAVAEARQRVLNSGLSVLQSEQGFIYEVYPNGDRVLVKNIELPTSVVSGSKFTIG